MASGLDINWIQRVGDQLSSLWNTVSAGNIFPITIQIIVGVAVVLLVALGIKRIAF